MEDEAQNTSSPGNKTEMTLPIVVTYKPQQVKFSK